MNFYFPRILPAVVMSLAPAFSSFSGDAVTPPQNPEKSEKAALEERVRQLEQQVQNLQNQLRDQGERDARPRFNVPAPQGQQGQQLDPNDPNAQQDPWAFRGNRNARDIFEQMRREMEQHLGNMEEWDGLGDTPFNNNRAGNGRGFSANRPRLGVDMRPVSDDLKERYKNDVKEGVFIVSIVPNTPAEKAGLRVGDAVIAFAGKDVKEPIDLQEAVRTAAPGKYAIIALRRGEKVALDVELGVQAEEEAPVAANRPGAGGWLRRGDSEGLNPTPGAPGPARREARQNSRTEIRASALELSEPLSTELKLSAEQKKKMEDVLAKHRAALNEDVATKTERSHPRRGAMSFFGGDVSQLVEKHAKDAETDLAGTLSPEQLKQWGDWRKQNNSVSVNQSMSIEGGTGGPGGKGAPAQQGGRATAPDNTGF